MAKKKAPELEARLFKNVYVCMNCNSKIRASIKKVQASEVKCRRCGSKTIRLKHKDIKA